jgi:putative flippase GtrA
VDAGIGIWLQAAVPVGGLAADALSHLLLSRLRRRGSYLTNLVLGGLVGLAATLALSVPPALRGGVSAHVAALVAVDVLTYLALAWCYFHFINILVASLRIRLLREIAAAGSLAREDILKRYNAEAVIARRLERLVAGGHLERKEGRLIARSPIFLVIFDFFQILKVAVLGRGNRLLAGVGVEPEVTASVVSLLRVVWTSRFIRFLVVGGVNTLFSYVLFSAFILSGVNYRATVLVCAVICIIFNFNTIGRIVFQNRDARLLARFLALYAVITLVNYFGLQLLVEVGRLHPLVGQAVVLPVIVALSFVLNRSWVFARCRLPPG